MKTTGEYMFRPQGIVHFVGAGPGSADLLTQRAVRALTMADVVVHDRLVTGEILDLIPPGTRRIDVGKEGFGPSTSQDSINQTLVFEARAGHFVVRLKSGDPAIFGRLEEEIETLEAADIDWQIVPGLTSASAAAAAIGQSLTARGRNTALTFLTGHDMQGFAEHDWRTLARPGAVAAIYMGKRAARLIQGRLMMHGAAPDTPVTLVENASRTDQRILASTLARLPADVASLQGPAILLFGLAPRAAAHALHSMKEATQ